jgi:hypothetical protein
MIANQLSIAIAISMCIGIVQWDLKTFAAAASEVKIDFDQVFADAARQGELNASIRDRLRHVGWYFVMTRTERGSPVAGYVNRASKSDRRANLKPVLPEPVLLPYCEPVASPFADPILGRIVGRCAA